MRKLSISLIRQATKTLHQWFLKTPIEYSKPLSDLLKVPIIFKCEYLQPAGSFKLRGAYFYLSQLTDAQKKQGIATCCIGDHGIALAYVSHLLNIPCTIYAPKIIPTFNKEKLLEFQAHLHFSRSECLQETLLWGKKQSTYRGFHFISSDDNSLIMAANGGSLAIEIIKDVPQVKNFILPIGQGDMLSGLSYFVKKKYPDVTIIGCEHEEVAALTLSLKKNKAIPTLPTINTLAHELNTSLAPKTFSILKDSVDHITLHDEPAILEGVRWMLKYHQCLIDPSAAIVIAACLSKKLPPLEGPTAIVLSGKNIGESTLKHLISSSLKK